MAFTVMTLLSLLGKRTCLIADLCFVSPFFCPFGRIFVSRQTSFHRQYIGSQEIRENFTLRDTKAIFSSPTRLLCVTNLFFSHVAYRDHRRSHFLVNQFVQNPINLKFLQVCLHDGAQLRLNLRNFLIFFRVQ